MSDAPEGMIPIEEFAKLKGITESKAMDMVRDGFYAGRKVGENWYVDASESTNSASKPSKTKGSVVVSSNGSTNEVVVTDIQMPFISMVVFMVKWVIASIPAFIILFIIFTVVAAIFGVLIDGLSSSWY
ncbi:MAG: hypothetical protein P8104_06535 [Gammaproteobacteria bacterium]